MTRPGRFIIVCSPLQHVVRQESMEAMRTRLIFPLLELAETVREAAILRVEADLNGEPRAP